jgi:hypothetical protein
MVTQKLLNINLLNTELNPICHLLVLLGARPVFHIIRIRVKNVRTLPVFIWLLVWRPEECQATTST